MNKKDLKKAIKNGQCIIVIDNNVEVRYKKNDEEIVTKYNITPVDVDEVDGIIMDTVNKCLSDNGEIRHYFVENVIIRAIIDNYTNIPNDMLDENDIEMLINNNAIVWSEEKCFVTRFRRAVREHLGVINGRNERSNEFTKFLNQLFVPFENDETGAIFKELIVQGVMDNLNNKGNMR